MALPHPIDNGIQDILFKFGPNGFQPNCPSGYAPIMTDLNQGTKSAGSIFACVKRGAGPVGLRDIQLLTGSTECPIGWTTVPTNLNLGAGGDNIYLCKQNSGPPFLQDIKITTNKNDSAARANVFGAGYTIMEPNLNQGAGGDAIYLWKKSADMGSFCKLDFNNLLYPPCREWCIKHPGECDAVARYYCNGKNTKFCACLNNKLADARFGVLPNCVDPNCIQYGYRNKTMADTKCPDIINCEMQVNLRNEGLLLGSDLNLQQNCGKSGNDSTSNTSTEVNKTDSETNVVDLDSSWLLFLIIFIVLISVAILVGVIWKARKNESIPYTIVNV